MLIWNNKTSFVATLLAGVALSSTAAWAQETTQNAESDAIIVTAQKREQNIQDVGVAVTALGAEALDSFDVNDSAALAIAIPSVQVQQYSPSVVVLNIRGVSQTDFSDFQEAPNAFYNDEVYIASMGAIAGQMFDLERVEVLRGPQGTLFGRNATGGLVQVVTAKPTREWEGFATLTGGEYNQISTEAAIGGPLSDTLSMRLAITSNNHDGYYNSLNPAIEDGASSDFLGGRAQVRFDLSTRDTFVFKAEYLRNDEESSNSLSARAAGFDPATNLGFILPPGSTFWANLAANPFGLPPFPGRPFVNPAEYFGQPNPFAPPLNPGGTFCAGCTVFGVALPQGPFTNDLNRPGIFDREYASFTGRFDHEFDAFTFTSISNYQTLDKAWAQDIDGSRLDLIFVRNDQEFTQFSQEFRLTGQTDRLNWVVGLYGLVLDTDVDGITHIDPAVAEFFASADVGTTALGTFAADGFSLSTQRTESMAAFGQVDYELNDTFAIVAGGRFTHDEKDYQFTSDSFTSLGQRFTAFDFKNRVTREEVFQETFPGSGVFFPTGVVATIPYGQVTGAPDLSSQEFENWSAKLQLEARLNEGALLYIGVNRGTKAGGFNAPRTWPEFRTYPNFGDLVAALAAFNDLMAFDEETLTNYEAGAKLTLADGRVNLNGSVFHYVYDNYQAFTNNNANLLIRNLPAEMTGVEVEFNARPIDALSLGGFVTYLPDAEASGVELPSGLVRDTRLPNTPEWSVGGSAAVEFALGDFGVLTLSTTWKYDSEIFFDVVNAEAHREEAKTVGNVRGTLDIGESVQLAAFVNNVTDEEYRIFASDNAFFISTIEENWGRPRWAGASITYRFGQ